jgi:hypothetical protein
VGHITRMGEKRNAYRSLVGKPEGRRPLGRPRRRYLMIVMFISLYQYALGRQAQHQMLLAVQLNNLLQALV